MWWASLPSRPFLCPPSSSTLNECQVPKSLQLREGLDSQNKRNVSGFSDSAVLVTLNVLSIVITVSGIIVEVILVAAVTIISLFQGCCEKFEWQRTHWSRVGLHLSGGEVWGPSQKPLLHLGCSCLHPSLYIYPCLVQVPDGQVMQLIFWCCESWLSGQVVNVKRCGNIGTWMIMLQNIFTTFSPQDQASPGDTKRKHDIQDGELSKWNETDFLSSIYTKINIVTSKRVITSSKSGTL